jgi:two-component system response regulator FixJ
VDDDASFRDSLRWLLGSAGYEVREYSSGESFLRECDQSTAACVVLDIQLPGMSGRDVKRALAARGDAPEVILVSGHVRTESMHIIAAAERCEFLAKPLDHERLLRLIDAAAARRTVQA